MSHPRTLIRNAVQKILSGQTDAQERVFKTRVIPFRQIKLPAIAIYTLDETIERDDSSRELTRSADLVIEGLVAVTNDADDQLDDLAEQIEEAMEGDIYLADTVGDAWLASTSMEILEDGDALLGLVTLTYMAIYRTPEMVQDDTLDDFRRVKADYRPGTVDEAEQAEDHITVQGTQEWPA